MPLQMIFTKRGSRPAIICDHCGQEITDARDGNVQWLPIQNEPVTPHFTHKRCFRAFDDAHKHLGWWSTEELACLPIRMAAVLKMNWKKAVNLTRLLSSF